MAEPQNGSYWMATGRLACHRTVTAAMSLKSESCKTVATLDPMTGTLLANVHEAGQQDVEKARIAARDAFDSGLGQECIPEIVVGGRSIRLLRGAVRRTQGSDESWDCRASIHILRRKPLLADSTDPAQT